MSNPDGNPPEHMANGAALRDEDVGLRLRLTRPTMIFGL